jgi:putative flippase GtrA
METDRPHGSPLIYDREPPRYSLPPADNPSDGRLVGLVTRVVGDRRVRYVLVGGAAAVVYYLIFSAGWLAFAERIPYLLMAVIANVCTAIVTYPLYRREVFQHTGPWLPGFLRFYATCLWALVFSLVGLPLLVEFGHLHVLLAQAIIIVASPLINYQIHRFWAFRESS